MIKTGDFSMTVLLILWVYFILSTPVRMEEIKELTSSIGSCIILGPNETPFLTSILNKTGDLIPVRRWIMFIENTI